LNISIFLNLSLINFSYFGDEELLLKDVDSFELKEDEESGTTQFYVNSNKVIYEKEIDRLFHYNHIIVEVNSYLEVKGNIGDDYNDSYPIIYFTGEKIVITTDYLRKEIGDNQWERKKFIVPFAKDEDIEVVNIRTDDRQYLTPSLDQCFNIIEFDDTIYVCSDEEEENVDGCPNDIEGKTRFTSWDDVYAGDTVTVYQKHNFWLNKEHFPFSTNEKINVLVKKGVELTMGEIYDKQVYVGSGCTSYYGFEITIDPSATREDTAVIYQLSSDPSIKSLFWGNIIETLHYDPILKLNCNNSVINLWKVAGVVNLKLSIDPGLNITAFLGELTPCPYGDPLTWLQFNLESYCAINQEKNITLISGERYTCYCLIEKEEDRVKCPEKMDVIFSVKEAIPSELYLKIFSYIPTVDFDLEVLLHNDNRYYYTYEGEGKSCINVKNARKIRGPNNHNPDRFFFSIFNTVALDVINIDTINVELSSIYTQYFDFEIDIPESVSLNVYFKDYFTTVEHTTSYAFAPHTHINFEGDGLLQLSRIFFHQENYKFDPRVIRVYDEAIDRILICPSAEEGENCKKQLLVFDNLAASDPYYEDTTIFLYSSDIYVPRNSSRLYIPTYLYLDQDEKEILLDQPIVRNIIPIPKYESHYEAKLLENSPTLKFAKVSTLQFSETDSISLCSKKLRGPVTFRRLPGVEFHSSITVDDRLNIEDNLDSKSNMDITLEVTKDNTIISFNKVSNNLPKIVVNGNGKEIKVFTGESSKEDIQYSITLNGGKVMYIEGVPEDVPEGLLSSTTTTEDKGLSGGAIAGIVISCIVVIGVLVALYIIKIRKRKDSDDTIVAV